MSENKKEEVKPEDMTFRNEAVKTIMALQKENEKLKNFVGRSRQRQRSRQRGGSGIVGLRGLAGFGSK